MEQLPEAGSAETAPRDPFTYVLQVLSFFNKDRKFNVKEIDIHRFFFELKKIRPELSDLFLFDDDPEIPYSADIADVLLRLQDAEVLSRPNPAMSVYMISANLDRTHRKILESHRDSLGQVADEFGQEFAME